MTDRSKLRAEQFLMLTHTPEGQAYGNAAGKAVSDSMAQRIQGDLFVEAQEDGLFPGHSQTSKRRA